ncbi:tumor protein D54-like isoform X3 [Seriola lalandi dorsalis]|uniref:tumor protein D54-like isoform X3 n=1 Tax=Seriola lalandi dorsalis TaxID=1841481 RepID=UPI000C6F739A|nr:tumor protein D54-like isoform X3 [Seriola lalandi dorsalis]XP_056242133.1 tumor protein D54-like isoform X4 [Seriola aureovittata]
MNRQGFGGAPSSINFSTGITGTAINECPPSDLTEEDLDSLRVELSKTEDEIQTLRQVLLAKEKYAADIRRQLGMSPLSNIKQNLSKGWQEVQTSAPYLTASATLEDISHSTVYVRTRESLSQAGQVTSSALSTMGVVITRRLAEMRRWCDVICVSVFIFMLQTQQSSASSKPTTHPEPHQTLRLSSLLRTWLAM